jgi:hypothetical protein
MLSFMCLIENRGQTFPRLTAVFSSQPPRRQRGESSANTLVRRFLLVNAKADRNVRASGKNAMRKT